MKRHHIAAVALIFFSSTALADKSPNFDCAKASSEAEKMIRFDQGNHELSEKKQ